MLLSWGTNEYAILTRPQERVYAKLAEACGGHPDRWFTAFDLFGRPGYKPSGELRSLRKLIEKRLAIARTNVLAQWEFRILPPGERPPRTVTQQNSSCPGSTP